MANNTIDANAPAEAEYLKAVEEGKAITTTINGKQWALGDLAAKVEKVYGENRLVKFAEDINFGGADCTLARYAVVCRAFPDKRGRPRFFVSAQALAAHPDCLTIVKSNPDISKAEAREIMHKWRAENPSTATSTEADQTEEDNLIDQEDTAPTSAATASTPAPTSAATTSTPATKAKGPKKTPDAVQADESSRDLKRWHAEVVVVANKVIELAEVKKRCTAVQQRDLLAVLQTPLTETVREASEALAELAAWFRKLSNEGADTAIREGRVKTSPKRAQEPRAEA